MEKEQKKKGCLKRFFIFVLIVGALIFVITEFRGTSTDPTVLSVQYSSPPGENVKMIKAFRKFFADPKWESIVAEDSNTYVNFSGKAFYGDNIELYKLQFLIGEDNGVSFWKLTAIEVDGEPQHSAIFGNTLLEKIYEGL